MNPCLKELILTIYKENNRNLDRVHAYVEQLNMIIIKITPNTFETFLKELIKPLQNRSTLLYEIDVVRKIVTHCIQLFNKIHQNKYPLYKEKDIDTIIKNITKETVIIKKKCYENK